MAADRTAMVIVHMQEGFAREDPPTRELADRIARWVDDHRDELDVLVTSRFRNEPGCTYHRLVGDEMSDDEEVALLPQVDRLQADLSCTAHTYNAATPEILDELRRRDVERVVVVGVDTDQCVLATVFTLFDAGFEPVVFEDLTRSGAGATPHEAGLVALRRAVGEDRVVSSDEFASRIRT